MKKILLIIVLITMSSFLFANDNNVKTTLTTNYQEFKYEFLNHNFKPINFGLKNEDYLLIINNTTLITLGYLTYKANPVNPRKTILLKPIL